MKFSYNWLQEHIKEKLPRPDKMVDLLTMHAFEIEDVKKLGQDHIFDIDVLANRGADCLNYFGMAREIGAVSGKTLKQLKTKKLKKVSGKDLKVIIDCSLVPRYSAMVVRDVKVGPSPLWLKKRLESAGVKSINNMVDLTNFIMLEIGQPLHAFDYDKISNQEMILRLSRKGEKLVTLDGKEHLLDQGILVIESGKKLIDLVGIMGGELAKVDSQTQNIVFQAGSFDRWTIYKASKKLNCLTEAANIYIHGTDPNSTVFALERVNYLLDCGKITNFIDIYPKKAFPRKIRLDLDYLEKILGLRIPLSEVKIILKRLGFKINNMIVEVPTQRLDINIPEDLIEEVGRIYGYDKIPASFPSASLIPALKNEEVVLENLIKDSLKEIGFSEVYNYSFINDKDVKDFGYKNLIELENPISAEQKYLRPSLIPNLLKNIKNNSRHLVFKNKELKMFEIGRVFEAPSIEQKNVSGIVSGPDSFLVAKGACDHILERISISNAWYDDVGVNKSAEIKSGNKTIGFIDLISGVSVFNFDFHKLYELSSEEKVYQPISCYPAAIRDIAILVPQKTKVVEVLNKINAIGGSLIQDIDLFDIYEGKELPQGKKNLAFHVIYQSDAKTLSSVEIDNIHNKIFKALEEDPSWKVRK